MQPRPNKRLLDETQPGISPDDPRLKLKKARLAKAAAAAAAAASAQKATTTGESSQATEESAKASGGQAAEAPSTSANDAAATAEAPRASTNDAHAASPVRAGGSAIVSLTVPTAESSTGTLRKSPSPDSSAKAVASSSVSTPSLAPPKKAQGSASAGASPILSLYALPPAKQNEDAEGSGQSGPSKEGPPVQGRRSSWASTFKPVTAPSSVSQPAVPPVGPAKERSRVPARSTALELIEASESAAEAQQLSAGVPPALVHMMRSYEAAPAPAPKALRALLDMTLSGQEKQAQSPKEAPQPLAGSLSLDADSNLAPTPLLGSSNSRAIPPPPILTQSSAKGPPPPLLGLGDAAAASAVKQSSRVQLRENGDPASPSLTDVSSPRRPRVPCRWYFGGQVCRYGQGCHFSHDLQDANGKMDQERSRTGSVEGSSRRPADEMNASYAGPSPVTERAPNLGDHRIEDRDPTSSHDRGSSSLTQYNNDYDYDQQSKSAPRDVWKTVDEQFDRQNESEQEGPTPAPREWRASGRAHEAFSYNPTRKGLYDYRSRDSYGAYDYDYEWRTAHERRDSSYDYRAGDDYSYRRSYDSYEDERRRAGSNNRPGAEPKDDGSKARAERERADRERAEAERERANREREREREREERRRREEKEREEKEREERRRQEERERAERRKREDEELEARRRREDQEREEKRRREEKELEERRQREELERREKERAEREREEQRLRELKEREEQAAAAARASEAAARADDSAARAAPRRKGMRAFTPDPELDQPPVSSVPQAQPPRGPKTPARAEVHTPEDVRSEPGGGSAPHSRQVSQAEPASEPNGHSSAAGSSWATAQVLSSEGAPIVDDLDRLLESVRGYFPDEYRITAETWAVFPLRLQHALRVMPGAWELLTDRSTRLDRELDEGLKDLLVSFYGDGAVRASADLLREPRSRSWEYFERLKARFGYFSLGAGPALTLPRGALPTRTWSELDARLRLARLALPAIWSVNVDNWVYAPGRMSHALKSVGLPDAHDVLFGHMQDARLDSVLRDWLIPILSDSTILHARRTIENPNKGASAIWRAVLTALNQFK